ncbi:MAG: hypothetical protein H0X47_01625 [Nitrospirales bacterium]|nr:hypothetical protein [Nitrospirales bacterium]
MLATKEPYFGVKVTELSIVGCKTSADSLRSFLCWPASRSLRYFCAGLPAVALAACAPKLASAAGAKAGGVRSQQRISLSGN